jgi:3-oxoacyl-[acyl-carrier protein] reductase
MTLSTDSPAVPDLKDKVVLITGGSTGIGAAAAIALGRNGAKLAINFRSTRAEAAAVAETIERAGSSAILIQADVKQPAAAADIISKTVAHFGRIDIVINNAGALSKRTPTIEASDDYIADLIELNATQVVRFVREAALQMRKQGGGGNIINVSSIAGRNGGGPGSVIYAAAKGFVGVATRGWAKELAADGIRVNAVSPGVITTPFHERCSTSEQLEAARTTVPMGRLGVPDDCVGAFLYLASESMSGYVTGQILEVNGGQYMP